MVLCIRADFWTDRNNFIKKEENEMLGSLVNLTEKESKVNQILMNFKYIEYDEGFLNPGTFAPSQHFFQARPLIEKSDVYKFLRKVPKGAALHGHDTALVSSEYFYKLTYKNNLYVCNFNGHLWLKFLENSTQDRTCNWTLLSVVRVLDPSYDSWLRSQINLTQKILGKNTRTSMRPVFEDYFYQSLKELYDDNVMYLEFRSTLPVLYELNGTTYTKNQTVSVYKKVIDKFKMDYPRFKGARLIYAPLKIDNASANQAVEIIEELKQVFPDFVAGFDLVGQEDTKAPISAYLSILKKIAGMGLDFFFHAGETNWYSTVSDFNLMDAILLGTKRIGHGYAITKHPLVMREIKKRKIAIEVCPISNQVLLLLSDMRNHPAATLIAQDFPIVISNDDPMLWNGKALTYDFYMAFMGIAGRSADLRFIKQLVINSLIYSSLPSNEKEAVILAWEIDWENFINDVLATSANEVL
ncbi:hypothetical protein FQR65_LT01947 [Abscondita terminalis]|nr:hypothetical protein FQR65_LT01947 [Abscondita terminalis]